MKQVYFYRADGYYDHMDVIKDDEQVPANATTLVPEGLYPRFDGTKWNPITREEFDKINPPVRQAAPQQPTRADQAMNMLGLQFAQAQQENDQKIEDLGKSINALGLQFAQFMKEHKDNGGN